MQRLAEKIVGPRAVGSEALGRATEAVAAELARLGFTVQRQSFDTSARRLAAVSLVGAGLGWIALASTLLLVLTMPAWAAPVLGVGGLGLVGLLAHGVNAGYLPSGMPVLQATNLIATRGTPRAWLVAHLDSKSQAFSLLTRVVAVVLAVGGTLGLLALLVVRLWGPLPWTVVALVSLPMLVGGGVLSRSAPGDDSPGAVDNASGVLALLAAARELRERTDIGLLVTSAEELGLEGARAWVAEQQAVGSFVNIDSIDGRGAFRVAVHGTAAGELGRRVADELRAAGWSASLGALPPGVLVDGVVLARADMRGITVSRGDLATLGAVHTPGDRLERLDFGAVAATARAAVRALEVVPTPS